MTVAASRWVWSVEVAALLLFCWEFFRLSVALLSHPHTAFQAKTLGPGISRFSVSETVFSLFVMPDCCDCVRLRHCPASFRLLAMGELKRGCGRDDGVENLEI